MIAGIVADGNPGVFVGFRTVKAGDPIEGVGTLPVDAKISRRIHNGIEREYLHLPDDAASVEKLYSILGGE